LARYFTSRPEIFSKAAATQGGPSTGDSNPFRKEITGAQAQAAAAAVNRAGSGAARFMSAGLKSLKSQGPSNTGGGGGGGGDGNASGPAVCVPTFCLVRRFLTFLLLLLRSVSC
jgi:abl interactor 2